MLGIWQDALVEIVVDGRPMWVLASKVRVGDVVNISLLEDTPEFTTVVNIYTDVVGEETPRMMFRGVGYDHPVLDDHHQFVLFTNLTTPTTIGQLWFPPATDRVFVFQLETAVTPAFVKVCTQAHRFIRAMTLPPTRPVVMDQRSFGPWLKWANAQPPRDPSSAVVITIYGLPLTELWTRIQHCQERSEWVLEEDLHEHLRLRVNQWAFHIDQEDHPLYEHLRTHPAAQRWLTRWRPNYRPDGIHLRGEGIPARVVDELVEELVWVSNHSWWEPPLLVQKSTEVVYSWGLSDGTADADRDRLQDKWGAYIEVDVAGNESILLNAHATAFAVLVRNGQHRILGRVDQMFRLIAEAEEWKQKHPRTSDEWYEVVGDCPFVQSLTTMVME